MPSKRCYDDACAAAHALDLVGERWALLVVRELLLGPKRFSDLRGGLPGVSPGVLSQRLDDLERAGVLRRETLPPPARIPVYALTPWGRELEPVIMALGRWGVRSPQRSQAADISLDALLLSLRAMFDPARLQGPGFRLGLRLNGEAFAAEVADGAFQIARGQAENPDAVIETDHRTLAGLVYGGQPLDDALRGGAVQLSGDPAAFARFLGLFPLPQPLPG